MLPIEFTDNWTNCMSLMHVRMDGCVACSPMIAIGCDSKSQSNVITNRNVEIEWMQCNHLTNYFLRASASEWYGFSVRAKSIQTIRGQYIITRVIGSWHYGQNTEYIHRSLNVSTCICLRSPSIFYSIELFHTTDSSSLLVRCFQSNFNSFSMVIGSRMSVVI